MVEVILIGVIQVNRLWMVGILLQDILVLMEIMMSMFG